MSDKYFLQSEQTKMDAAAFIDRAREMAKALEDRETGAVGSRLIARQRIARLTGVPESLLHSLRYRPPKAIAADAYARLCATLEAQAIDQIRKAFDEIAAARARRPGADDRNLREIETALAKAHALLGDINGKTKENRSNR